MVNKILKSSVVFILLAVSSSLSFGVAPEPDDLNGKPSFDCNKASTEVEKRICNSSSVAALDVILSDLYKKIRSFGNDSVRDSQRAWLKTRNDCLSNDIGWFRDPLAECYFNRIQELRLEYSIELSNEEYFNIAEKVLKRIVSDSATDGEKFIFVNNFKSFADNLHQNFCWYVPEYIVFENDYFLKTEYWGSQTCGGSSFPIRGKIVYCKNTEGRFSEGDVWNCRENRQNIKVLLETISKNSFSSFTPSEDDWTPREFDTTLKSQSTVLPYLYSSQIHILSSPYFFSNGLIKAIDENLTALKKSLDFPEDELTYLMSGMKCTYEAVTSSDNWEDVLKSDPPGNWGLPKGYFWYGKQFSGCDSFDKRISNEMYTEKELFILLWKQFYSAKSMDLAISILDRELQAAVN